LFSPFPPPYDPPDQHNTIIPTLTQPELFRMSTMSTNAAPVTLQTNLRELNPTNDFKPQHVLYCQLNVAHDANVHSDAKNPASELLAVRQATKNFLEESKCIMSTIDKNHFFANPDCEEKLKLHASKRYVLLTVYDGKVEPSNEAVSFDYASACLSGGSFPDIAFETAPSPFKRSSGKHSSDKQQWYRTQIISSNMSHLELVSAFERFHLALDPKLGVLPRYCHALVVKTQTLEVNSLISSIAQGVDFADKSADIQIPLASLNELIRVINPPTTLFINIESVQDSDGLTLRLGTSSNLYRGAAPRLLVAEKSHIHATPDPKLHTLADFLKKQLASTWSKTERAAKLKSLCAMLKGMEVGVRVKGLQEKHKVAEVLDGSSQSAPPSSRHRAWTAKHEDYPLADLPCLNVGSLREPVLLPPELCTILPDQDLRRGHTPSLARLIDSIRRSDSPIQTANTELLSGWRIKHRQNSEKVDDLQVVFDNLGGALPTILFLEAGTEAIECPSWDSVRRLLKQSLKRVCQQSKTQTPDKDGPLLSLTYDNASDVGGLWTEQIHRFASKHGSHARKVILIVYVHSDKQKMRSNMYNIIKRASDVKLGIESIFVDRDTLKSKSHMSPEEGPSRVVGSIYRKLRIRNSPMLADMSTNTPSSKKSHSSAEPRHLVISIHVKPFTSQSPFLLNDGTSRSHGPEMFLVALVSRAVDSPADYHTEVKLLSKLDFKKFDVSTLFNEVFDAIKGSSHRLTVLRSGHLVDGPADLRQEIGDIAKAYDRVRNRTRFTYATLSEDKLLEVRVDGQDITTHGNKDFDLLIAKFDARADKDQSRFWVFQNKAGVNCSSGIKVNFLYDSLLSSSPPPSISEPSGSKGDETPPEVKLFGYIWKDEHLELYDTKWPIPTYLAQLALDRALIHVVTNDGKNKQNTQTTPVYLPKVHKTVGNTLYYV